MFGKLATKLTPSIPQSTCTHVLPMISNGITTISLADADTGTMCGTEAPVIVSVDGMRGFLTKRCTIARYVAILRRRLSAQKTGFGHLT